MSYLTVHPGVILRESFLRPLGITAYRLSKETGVDQTRVSQILNGKRAITADTSLRFSKFFGLEESFWLQAQIAYDLEHAKERISSQLEAIRPYSPK